MEPIYLEQDEEITSVVDKLRAASSGKLALVVPKNSTLFQSLVNLKLLAKQAKELNKEVSIISANKVGQRLATQVGIPTFSSLGTLKAPEISTPTLPVKDAVNEVLPDGTPIRRYVPPTSAESSAEEPPVDEPIMAAPAPIEPISVNSEDETLPTEESPVSDDSLKEEKPSDLETVVAPVVTADVVSAPTQSIDSSDDLPPIVSRTPITKPEFHLQVPWKSVVAALILLCLAFGVVYFLLPKATVVVTLPASEISETLTLSARSEASDDDQAVIPGQPVVVEKTVTKSITATGKKDIGTKSSGQISLFNEDSSSSVTISAGTKLSTSSKDFVLDKATTIPGATISGGKLVAGKANGSITASVAGDSYNVSSAKFTISGQPALIYGSGSTTGGTTKQVTVLSQEDVDKAFVELEKQAIEEVTTEFNSKTEGATLLENSTTQTVKNKSTDKAIGDQVDTAEAKMTLELRATTFSKDLAIERLKDSLTKKLEDNQRLEIPENNQPTLTFKEYSEDKATMVFVVAGSGYGVPDISKSEVAKAIRHKSTSSVETYLKETYQAEEVKITMSPQWWFGRLPVLPNAISVEYGFTNENKETTE